MSKIYLASKSPRRKELLAGLGIEFDVVAVNDHTLLNFAGDEEQHPGEAPGVQSLIPVYQSDS